MPPKRRIEKTKHQGISEAMWAAMNDAVIPADANPFEALELEFPSLHPEYRAQWEGHREVVLSEYASENPGYRPSWWWIFDAPEPRRRISGIGTPKHEVLNEVPSFSYGIPDRWLAAEDEAGVAIDPRNPPTYESQPTYLARHGLLTPTEHRRLKPKDFEPEMIATEETED